MKRRYIVLFILTMLILPSQIKAICDDSKVSLMQQYSKDISYVYTYDETYDSVTFDITFTNLKNVIAIKNPIDNKYYSDAKEVTFKNLKPNKGYTFEIYASGFCPLTPLKTLYIEMPGYNKYYKDEICDGLDDFKYCQKWINLPFGYERLKQEIAKYNESIQKKEEKTKKNNSKLGEIVGMIFSKEGLAILSILVMCGVIVMELRERKSDLN